MTMLRLISAYRVDICEETIMVWTSKDRFRIQNRIEDVWVDDTSITFLVRGVMLDYQITIPKTEV